MIYHQRTFAPTETVHIDGHRYHACIFDGCKIVGDIKKSGFIRCMFEGQAGKWFSKAVKPHTVLTVELW